MKGFRFQVVLLLALVALPYLSSVRFAFVYDDHGSIVENTFLQDATNVCAAAKLQTFSDPHVVDGQRPLVLLTYFMDRALWGLHPTGYHATNLALHLLASLFVFLFVHSLRLPTAGASSMFVPSVAMLAFGLHPVLTEAVQMPSFREDILVTLSGVCSLWLAVTFRSSFFGMAGSAVALALALLSKESAVVVPLILVWTWICVPSVRPSPRAGIALLAVQVTLAMAYVVHAYAARPLQAIGAAWNGLSLRVPENFLTAPSLFIESLGMLILPGGLCVEQLVTPVQSAADERFSTGIAILLVYAVLAVVVRRRMPAVALGMGWMLVAWLPVSNLIPLLNPFGERYLYLLAPGFALLAAATIATLLSRRAAVTVAVCVFMIYAGVAVERLQDWRDDETLWKATLRDEPHSARAHTWLGLMAKERGQRNEAVRYFIRAESLNPQDVAALMNLAQMAAEGGNLPVAEQMLREAARRRPDRADVRWNLAMALVYSGQYGEAAVQINATYRLDRHHREAARIVAAMNAARKK